MSNAIYGEEYDAPIERLFVAGVVPSDSLGGVYDQRPPFPIEYYNSRHSIGDMQSPFEQFPLPQYTGPLPPFVQSSADWPPPGSGGPSTIYGQIDPEWVWDNPPEWPTLVMRGPSRIYAQSEEEAEGVIAPDAWDVMGPIAHSNPSPFPSPSDVAGGRFLAMGRSPRG